MAARLNVKFILILFIVCATAGGTLLGVAYFKMKGDAGRHIRAGDAALAAGDYEDACSKYLRAVGKDPTNIEYLDKAIDAMLQRTPETTDEARELYMTYISMLAHGATHQPLDAEQHLRLLDELYASARYAASLGSAAYWGNVVSAATTMEDRLPDSHPDRVWAKFYRGAARVEPTMFEQLPPENPDEGTQIEQGERDLREFLEAKPGSDRAWAALIRGQLADARRIRKSGYETDAAARLAELMETVEAAREAVPNGPEARLAALEATGFAQAARADGDGDQVDPAARERLIADAREVAQLVEKYATDDDRKAFLIAELAGPMGVLRQLSWVGGDELPDSVDIFERYLAAHPNHHALRYLQALGHFTSGDLDEAESSTAVIREAPLMTVGLRSQLQAFLKEKAVFLEARIAFQRINALEEQEDAEAERERLIARLRAKHDELEEMVTNPDLSSDFVHVEGLLAFAERDFARAAERFDHLVSNWEPTVEALMLAASAVELTGNVSGALALVQRLNEKTDYREPAFLEREIRLLLRERGYEEARDLAVQLADLESERGVPEANRRAPIWLDRTEQALASLDAENDPIRRTLDEAQSALRENDFDAARAILTEALDSSPNDLRLLNGIIRVEIGAGRTDEARRWLDRALEISPGNRSFIGLGVVMEEDDPATRVREYEYLLGQTDAERAVGAAVGLLRLARRSEAQAERLEGQGDADQAAEQRRIAERAREMMAEETAKARRLAPDDPDFIEFRFLEAFDREDWAEVERIVARATELNIDQAGGATYEGRYHLAIGETDQAIRAFREASESISYSGSVWRSLGLAFEQAGRFDEAVEAFEAAYTRNKNDLRTVVPYVKLLTRVGEKLRALEIVTRARRVAPNNEELREIWLALEYDVGDRARVLRERIKTYEEDPDNRSNAARLAVIYGTVEPTRQLLLDDNGDPLYSVDKWSRTGESARRTILEQARRDWHARADRILESMAEPGERDLSWYRLRADLLRARGEVQAGSDVLRDWARRQTEPEDQLAALLALGLYEQSADRLRRALSAFQEAQQFQSAEGREADVALASLLFKLRQFEPAAQFLESVVEVRDQRELKLQLLECYVKLNRGTEARELLAELRDDGADEDVLVMMEALILDNELSDLHASGQTDQVLRKFEEFNETLARAAQLNPGDPRPHVLRAGGLLKAYQRTGDQLLLDEALSALERADSVRADALETGRMRVAVYLAKGPVYTRSAIGELRRILDDYPYEDELRMQLLQLLRREGDVQTALEVVQDAVERNPGSLQWRETLGDVYLSGLGQPEQAAEAYAAALAIDPDSARLVGKRAESLMATDPPSVRPAYELLRNHPEMIEANAVLRQVYARAVAMTGDTEQALEQMRLAYQKHQELIEAERESPSILNNWLADLARLKQWDGPEAVEAFVTELSGGELDPIELLGIAGLYRAMQGRDGLSRAVELQRQAVERSDEADEALRTSLLTSLGVNLLLLERDAQAIETFLKVIELDPNNSRALNNLAHLYSERMDDPEKALPYAERAAEVDADNWAVLDTLGWVHYQLEAYDLAERHLRRSVRARETAMNHLHLAHLYRTRGDRARALQYLERAAELQPDPETQAEIDRLSDDIRTDRAGDE